VGGAHERAAAARLFVRQRACATRWPSTRSIQCGVYFGTPAVRCTRPQMRATLGPIVRDLPAVLSLEVATLP